MFRNIRKEKELFERELEQWKKEKLLAVETEIENYRFKRNLEMQNLAKQCSEELGQYEHTYHSSKEVKGIELSKLDAKIEYSLKLIEAREEVIKADNNLFKSKDAEIKRLNDIINLLVSKQPQTVIQQLPTR